MPVPTMVNDPFWDGSKVIEENLIFLVVWIQAVRYSWRVLAMMRTSDMSTNIFRFTADNIRLDIIRKVKGRKYLVRISLILFKLSRIFSHLNQEIFYFVFDFYHCKVLHIII